MTQLILLHAGSRILQISSHLKADLNMLRQLELSKKISFSIGKLHEGFLALAFSTMLFRLSGRDIGVLGVAFRLENFPLAFTLCSLCV